MNYYSTRNKDSQTTLKEVVLNGLAEDGGLYLPEKINKLSPDFWQLAGSLSYLEILKEVLKTLVGDNSGLDLHKINLELDKVFTFKPELITLAKNRYILDLNTGPTSAFKDYGANLLGVFLRTLDTKKTVIVATSGDTGSAVANALKDLNDNPNIHVVVLYPKGRVSDDQRKLMTTVGYNVTCLEIDGSFDDCQALVKQALQDPLLRSQLTSANSINLIRLYGQVAYYIYATTRVGIKNKFIFSVPSGNLGNLTAGYIAFLMGNPTSKFIVSHNSNDMFNTFVLEGVMKNHTTSIQTISSAMDVYKPSNLERLIVLFGGSFDNKGQILKMPNIDSLQEQFYVQGFNDLETKAKMLEIYTKFRLEIDPHTAVGLLGVDHAIKGEHPEFAEYTIITLSTAHPSKFDSVFKQVVGKAAIVSQPILEVRSKIEKYETMENDYKIFAEFLTNKKYFL
jgi:threonine synthase